MKPSVPLLPKGGRLLEVAGCLTGYRAFSYLGKRTCLPGRKHAEWTLDRVITLAQGVAHLETRGACVPDFFGQAFRATVIRSHKSC